MRQLQYAMLRTASLLSFLEFSICILACQACCGPAWQTWSNLADTLVAAAELAADGAKCSAAAHTPGAPPAAGTDSGLHPLHVSRPSLARARTGHAPHARCGQFGRRGSMCGPLALLAQHMSARQATLTCC
jgi:hypothetical protein